MIFSSPCSKQASEQKYAQREACPKRSCARKRVQRVRNLLYVDSGWLLRLYHLPDWCRARCFLRVSYWVLLIYSWEYTFQKVWDRWCHLKQSFLPLQLTLSPECLIQSTIWDPFCLGSWFLLWFSSLPDFGMEKICGDPSCSSTSDVWFLIVVRWLSESGYDDKAPTVDFTCELPMCSRGMEASRRAAANWRCMCGGLPLLALIASFTRSTMLPCTTAPSLRSCLTFPTWRSSRKIFAALLRCVFSTLSTIARSLCFSSFEGPTLVSGSAFDKYFVLKYLINNF